MSTELVGAILITPRNRLRVVNHGTHVSVYADYKITAEGQWHFDHDAGITLPKEHVQELTILLEGATQLESAAEEKKT